MATSVRGVDISRVARAQLCRISGDAMKRFRLGTLMLLIVIVALSIALVVQHDRASRREAELQAQLGKQEAINEVRNTVQTLERMEFAAQWDRSQEWSQFRSTRRQRVWRLGRERRAPRVLRRSSARGEGGARTRTAASPSSANR
jgi:hypothetical protein